MYDNEELEGHNVAAMENSGGPKGHCSGQKRQYQSMGALSSVIAQFCSIGISRQFDLYHYGHRIMSGPFHSLSANIPVSIFNNIDIKIITMS